MSGLLEYRVCPECGAEYRPEVARCIDCDVALVRPDEAPGPGAAPASFPPAAELECVRVAPMAWIRALSLALRQGGVTHRVEQARAEDAPPGQRPDVFGDVPLFALYLRSEHAAAARELDTTIAAQLLPEEAPPLAEGEEEACPACGTALAPDAVECPDCGLAFA